MIFVVSEYVMASVGTRSTTGSILKEAENALANGLFKEAEDLFSRVIQIDPSNPVFFEGRSSARIQLQSFEDALHDAERAIELNPDLIMGYFRLGVALECLGEYSQSIVAFSEGLLRDRKNPQLLNAIIEVSLTSPIRSSLEPVMSQLRKMKLDTNPFVIASVIGQELLSHEYVEDAVQVLENAVAIGTRSLKLKGSVFSALSSALWSLGDTERALHYMKEDLAVSRLLADCSGECRAHGNLGAAYFSQGNYQLATENHNRQLALAQTIQDDKAMASAFSSLGHVHTALGNHQSAAESHKQSAAIFRNAKDIIGWCRQLNMVACSYLSLSDLDSALQWQLECLRVTTDEFDSRDGAKEEAKARVDLAAIYHKMQKYTEEIFCLQKAAEITQNIGDLGTEAQILSSLGYITRYTGDLAKAQASYERLLKLALTSSDRSMEAKACANLGVIHHQIGDFEMALKLQAQNLELSLEFRDVGSQGRAHGNIGNAYSAMGMYEQAIQHHLKELEISSLAGDQASECSTHGNLAVAYQAMSNHEKAFYHYNCQTSLASQIGDATNESRGYMNLGNFHSSRKEYRPAIEIYSKYLDVVGPNSSEKPAGIAKACYNIGFAFFSLREYGDAINFYEKSLKISLEIGDTVCVARTYCNLGLALKSYGDEDQALECQNAFLQCSNQLQSIRGIFKALGNIGDIYATKRQYTDALTLYQQQYDLAKQNNSEMMEAQASAALGVAYRLIGEYQRAIEYHTEELQIYQNVKDAKNEFRAYGHLGAVLTSLEEYSGAAKCYENQCYVAQKINDPKLQSTALGNMGVTSINLQDFERAIDFFERQLLIVENLPESRLDKGKVLCNIGDCYEALQNYNEAIALFEEALDCIAGSKHGASLERVYRGLTSAYKLSNKPDEAFKFCRLRVQTCHELQNFELLAEAYGELGYLFTMMADFENALSCLSDQMKHAENFPHLRADAACGLGSVYQMMRDYRKAVEYHQLDLEIANESNNLPCQGRAHGNLGAAYESLHNHRMAVKHQEQHLFIADSLNDPFAKLTALRGVARNVLRLGTNQQRAALLLQQALLLAQELKAKDEEGRVILDLALANWVCGDLENAEIQLREARIILTEEFWKSGVTDGGMHISIHPNLCIDLFEELLSCQSALTCLYVNTNQHSRALEAAENLRNFPELVASKILKRNIPKISEKLDNLTQSLVKYSTEKDSVILYYCVQAGAILTWVITPGEGLCGFERQPILMQDRIEGPDEVKGHENDSTSQSFVEQQNLLTHLITELRLSLGLEAPSGDFEEPPSGENGSQTTQDDNATGRENLEKISECNTGSNTAFRTFHRLIVSQTSMSYSKSISTLGTVGPCDASLLKKPPIYALYELLIGKIYEKIQRYSSKRPLKKLVLVAEGELLLVPFSLLKKRPTESYLSQQFTLRVIPSASDLFAEDKVQRSNFTGHITRGFVVGNPEVCDISSVPLSQASEDEANLVGTLLSVESVTGKNATKEIFTRKIQSAECVHFACGVKEQPPYGILLSSGNAAGKKASILERISSNVSNADSGIVKDTNLGQEDTFDLGNEDMTLSPKQMGQRSFTMDDVLNCDLSHTKVTVFGSAHLQESNCPGGILNSKHIKIQATARSFIFSGVQALLLPLWPVPETACRILTQSFYARLMDGFSTSEALNQSLEILRNSEQFEHPSYWAGFVLIGQDVTLDPRNLPLFHALRLLIESDPQRFHDTLRLAIHLLDKALERMDSDDGNTNNPMYASQASISKKVQNVKGWRELFSAIRFKLRHSAIGIPDAAFFPQAEFKEDVLKMKSELISYVQLPLLVLTGLNRLFPVPSVGYSLKESLANCLDEYQKANERHDDCENVSRQQLSLIIQQTTWRAGSCPDLLPALGFKVSQIGEENVMLHCTPDHHDNVETVLRLLSMFFSDPPFEKDDQDEPSKSSETHRNKTDNNEQALRQLQLSNTMIRGLPPSTRRSIAVDFNASFKSQSSQESPQHLELPDHMTNSPNHEENHATKSVNHEKNPLKKLDAPKKFTTAPSGGGVIAPRPVFPPTQSSLPVAARDPILPTQQDADAISSHSIQRSKKFQFHGSGSVNTTFDTLEVKIPRNLQKSPMFYRKSDDQNNFNGKTVDNTPASSVNGAQALLQQSLKTIASNINSDQKKYKDAETTLGPIPDQVSSPPSPTGNNHTHFVPIQSPGEVSVNVLSPGSVVYPKPKRPGEDAQSQSDGAKFKGERSSPYIPFVSIQGPSEVSANVHSPGNVVYPTPKRPGEDARSQFDGERSSPYVPAPSVARGMHAKSNPFDYTHIVDKLTRLSTSDLSDSGQGHTKDAQGHDANDNTFPEAGNWKPSVTLPLRSPHEHVKVLSYLRPELPQISMATDLYQRSPQVGAEEFSVPPSRMKDMNQHPGAHIYSRSLDGGIEDYRIVPSSHKHSLSHADLPPPPYKHPEIVTSPRRVSGDPLHSRTSSRASHSSAGSQKPIQMKKDQPNSTKMRKPLRKDNSNQSFSGSEGSSQVSYQLETSNQGKQWYIHESESPEPCQKPTISGNPNKRMVQPLSPESYQRPSISGNPSKRQSPEPYQRPSMSGNPNERTVQTLSGPNVPAYHLATEAREHLPRFESTKTSQDVFVLSGYPKPQHEHEQHKRFCSPSYQMNRTTAQTSIGLDDFNQQTNNEIHQHNYQNPNLSFSTDSQHKREYGYQDASGTHQQSQHGLRSGNLLLENQYSSQHQQNMIQTFGAQLVPDADLNLQSGNQQFQPRAPGNLVGVQVPSPGPSMTPSYQAPGNYISQPTKFGYRTTQYRQVRPPKVVGQNQTNSETLRTNSTGPNTKQKGHDIAFV